MPERSVAYKEKQKQSRLQVRRNVLALLGNKCKSCGHTDERVLQLDHINRATEPQGHSWRSGYGLCRAILLGLKDIQGFQLLCANCNFLKKLDNKEFFPTRKEN